MMTLTFSLLLLTLRPILDITESWFRRGFIDDPLEEYLISGLVDGFYNFLSICISNFLESENLNY